MKKWIFVLLIFVLTSCTVKLPEYNVYDDDAKIVKNTTSMSNRSSETHMNNLYNIVVGTFNGTKLRWNLDSKAGGTITVVYDLNVTKGRFKLVLISPDKNVTTIFEGTGSGSKTLKLEGGINEIKFVGDQAGFSLKIEL